VRTASLAPPCAARMGPRSTAPPMFAVVVHAAVTVQFIAKLQCS
jgi:hypothetical protein